MPYPPNQFRHPSDGMIYTAIPARSYPQLDIEKGRFLETNGFSENLVKPWVICHCLAIAHLKL